MTNHSEQAQRRTFLLLVSTFISVQIVILALAFGALWMGNVTRAYTAAEALYAKGQKQAVYALQRYAYSEDQTDFASYERRIQVPIGYKQAREAMETVPPNLDAARAGLLQGRNHPDDVRAMIRFFLWFSDTPLFEPALENWQRADGIIEQIADHAKAMHQAIQAGTLEPERRGHLLAEVQGLDAEVTLLQDEFAGTLGESARLVRNWAIALLGLASGLLWIGSVWFGWHLHGRSVAAEIALAQREQRLRTLMNSTADGIISIRPDCRIDAVNRAATDMFGRDAYDLPQRTISELVAPKDREEFTAAALDALRGDRPERTQHELTLDGRRADATVFPMEIAFTRQEGTTEPRLIVTLRDITERRATEAALFRAQKMEAVGQLTGGIAHDFNNLLMVVISNLEVLRTREEQHSGRMGPDHGDKQELIEAALSAADRATRMTSNLLAFSRRQPLAPRPVDVDALIRDMGELFDQSLSAAVELTCDLRSSGWQAMVDPVQLESALLNLVINASQAMPEGGHLTIETRQLTWSAPPGASLDLQTGEYVVIRVRDTGCGIPAEQREKIFEPFFTTKDVTQGSGLGLSMVHGFVRQSGGGIRLDSQLNSGTTVELFLPRAQAAPETAPAPTPGAASECAVRVLVVDDDPAVRSATALLLEGLGHDVRVASDGPSALESLDRHNAIDLVLSDVVLPAGMDGYALASQLRMRHPDLRVLLMSGYTRDALGGAEHSAIRLLQKPFTGEQLQQTIAETMAQACKDGEA